MPLPLAGVRVLDLTRLLPGAYATLLLADLGADVVKIEDPRGGDPSRRLPPVPHGTTAYFEVLNRNKRSVTLNLRATSAAAVVEALVRATDILVESFRPHTARRLGVDAATLRGRHPRLIHASISGFGPSGPRAERAAHDINFEALSGLLTLRRTPEVPRMLVGDIGAAYCAVAGILAALYQRERTGVGAAVSASIQDAALGWLLFPAARRLAGDEHEDEIELPVSGGSACYNVYRTADDLFVALGALEPKFWTTFCERIGRPDFIPIQYAPGEDQARMLDAVRAMMRTRTQAEWLALFADVDVCLTPVVDVETTLADPNLREQGVVSAVGSRTYITSPVVVAGETRVAVTPAPALGADTDTILAEAGIGDDARQQLRASGVI